MIFDPDIALIPIFSKTKNFWKKRRFSGQKLLLCKSKVALPSSSGKKVPLFHPLIDIQAGETKIFPKKEFVHLPRILH